MKKSIISSSPLQTKTIARALAQTLIENQPARGATVIALAGELGSGKTTFAQGFAKGLGTKEKILSPTFILIRCYELKAKNYKLLYHIDCYRLDDPAEELLRLGFKEIIQNPQNIVVAEWADRIKKILPKDTLWIVFRAAGVRGRVIVIG